MLLSIAKKLRKPTGDGTKVPLSTNSITIKHRRPGVLVINLRGKPHANQENRPARPFSIRDKLLVKEVLEMESILPASCSVEFPDPDVLHTFDLTICPEEGYWRKGKFEFNVQVPEAYNLAPPIVTCRTKLWHPNINEDGVVCLSILRETTIAEDAGLGWTPARRLKEVVWGLNSLFTDLLDFNDPLNQEAADQYKEDEESFKKKVKKYIKKYAKRK